jgi:hypothetical protein
MTLKAMIALALLRRFWEWLTASEQVRRYRQIEKNFALDVQLHNQFESGCLNAKRYESRCHLNDAAIKRLYYEDSLPLFARWRFHLFGSKKRRDETNGERFGKDLRSRTCKYPCKSKILVGCRPRRGST